MTMKTSTALTPPDVKDVGFLTKYLSKVFGGLTPAEQQEMLSDAAALSGGALGKAEDLMRQRADAGADTVEDLWDGAPDDQLRTTRVNGPGTRQAGGTVPVGATEAASGRGAEAMERTYSRPARQGGVQTATERLGADLMKAILDLVKAQGAQLAILQSAVLGKAEDEEEEEEGEKALRAQIAQTTNPVVRKALRTALKSLKAAKAEGMEDDEEEEGEKALRAQIAKAATPAARNLFRKALEVLKGEKVDMEEEEEEEEDEGEKALRAQIAQAPTAKAKNALQKALDALQKAKKASGAAADQAENQDKWPASKGSAPAQDLAKAVDAIKQAVDGFGMLQANMRDVMMAAGGVSKSANGLPPVFELVKSNPEAETNSRITKINDMVASGAISEAEGDRASDALMRMKAAAEGRLDSTIAMSTLDKTLTRLPPIVQRDIFGQAA